MLGKVFPIGTQRFEGGFPVDVECVGERELRLLEEGYKLLKVRKGYLARMPVPFRQIEGRLACKGPQDSVGGLIDWFPVSDGLFSGSGVESVEPLGDVGRACDWAAWRVDRLLDDGLFDGSPVVGLVTRSLGAGVIVPSGSCVNVFEPR
jgi:hypothetical protein